MASSSDDEFPSGIARLLAASDQVLGLPVALVLPDGPMLGLAACSRPLPTDAVQAWPASLCYAPALPAGLRAAAPVPLPEGGRPGCLLALGDGPALPEDSHRTLAAMADLAATLLDARAHRRDIHADNERLREALDILPQAITILDAQDRYVLWNRRYAEYYASSADLLRPGLPFVDFLRGSLDRQQTPEAIGREDEWLAERLIRHHQPHSIHEHELDSGRWVRVEERRTQDGGHVGIRVDITDLKRREDKFRVLFDTNPVPMYVYARDTLSFLAVNDAALAFYGYDRATFLGMTLLDVRPPSEHARLKTVVQRFGAEYAPSSPVTHRRSGNREAIVRIHARAINHEDRDAILVTVVDETERQRAEAKLAYLAHHDALTGLRNRVGLGRDLTDMAVGDIGGLVALHLDLSGFRHINDVLGSATGDALLATVGGRLSACLAPGDTAARLAGDVFAIVRRPQPGTDPGAAASALAASLLEAVSAPYDIDGHQLVTGASLGLAVGPMDGATPEALLRHSDLALQRAKAEGRGVVRRFDSAMTDGIEDRRALEVDLRRAMAAGEISLHYQPIVAASTGQLAGFEALLRWHHPERGMISPATFIPVAEASKLIVPLGEWALHEACREAARWPRPVRVAVNLSPVQFTSPSLGRAVLSALASSGLDPRRLELEITESVALADHEANLAVLQGFRALGARVALDDFGTGYSSLSYLRAFPFDKIKIDRSFVSDLPDSGDCLAIIRAVTGLASSLGITSTAEGVETEAQLQRLRLEGCDEIQGYLFGRPMPASELPALMAKPNLIAA